MGGRLLLLLWGKTLRGESWIDLAGSEDPTPLGSGNELVHQNHLERRQDPSPEVEQSAATTRTPGMSGPRGTDSGEGKFLPGQLRDVGPREQTVWRDPRPPTP